MNVTEHADAMVTGGQVVTVGEARFVSDAFLIKISHLPADASRDTPEADAIVAGKMGLDGPKGTKKPIGE